MAIQQNRAYIVRAEFAPSTPTAETVYFALKNTGIGALALKEFSPQLLFTGVGVAGVSTFALQRCTGTATGGTVIAPTKYVSVMADPSADVRMANAGLGGITPPATDRFYLCGIPNQPGIGVVIPPALLLQDENPIIIGPGENLILVAHTTIVAGARLAGLFKFYEVA